jgi:lysophospholipase L1-like esterase
VLDEHDPQLLILCHGGNDLLRQRDPGHIQAQIESMVSLSRDRGVPVLLLGVPRPALFGLESAELYSTLAEHLHLPLEGEVIPQVLSRRDLKSDRIHPNAEGYRRIAEAVFRLLQRTGAL